MKEDFESAKAKFRKELDELKVQLALGKAEASDHFEKKKAEFAALVDDTKARLEKLEAGPKETAATARQKLDELKVQLELGKMETIDTYREQREKLHSAVDAAKEHVGKLEGSATEQIGHARHSFEHGAEAFKTKLEALAINLGAGAHVAKEEVFEACDKVAEAVYEATGFVEKEIHDAHVYLKKLLTHDSDK